MKTIFALLLYAAAFVHSAQPVRWFEGEMAGEPVPLRSLQYGNNHWWGYSPYRYSSDDGVKWVHRSWNQNSTKPEFLRGEFYFLTETVYASSNGWSDFRIVGAPFGGAGPIQGFVFGNEQFYAIQHDQIAVSPNASNWVHHTLPELNGELRFMAAGNGVVVLMTTRGSIYTSANAEQWERYDAGVSFRDLKATPAGFLLIQVITSTVLCCETSFLLYFSPDGRTWNVVQERRGYADRIAVGDGLAVVWGADVLGTVSLDGRNWTEVTRSSTKTIVDIAYGDGRFLGVLYPTGLLSSRRLTPVQVKGIRRNGNRISLEADPNESYAVEQTSRLGDPWTEVPVTASRDGIMELDLSETGNAFFRLRIKP